jgi:hypothetical protein
MTTPGGQIQALSDSTRAAQPIGLRTPGTELRPLLVEGPLNMMGGSNGLQDEMLEKTFPIARSPRDKGFIIDKDLLERPRDGALAERSAPDRGSW